MQKKIGYKRTDYISWDQYFMGIAQLSAHRSKDPNTQVGACIVGEDNRILSVGYNGMPEGCDDDDMPWEREGESVLDTKYPFVCHAELNAILNARGKNLKGDPAAAVNLEELCKSIGIERVRVVDPYNLKECEDAIMEELSVEAPSVIISRRPCMLLKYVKAKPPVKVNNDKCVGCRQCMKLGCPAISFKDKKAVIDFTQCVGCDVCTQLCRVGAIEKGER